MSTFTFSPSSKVVKSNSTASTQNDPRISTYKQFGHGRYSYELARDLLKFRDEATSSTPGIPANFGFWAVFEASDDLSESEFQKCLWNELSFLIRHSEVSGNWEPQLCTDSENNILCFTLDGTTFKVTGMHPYSSSPSQRFMHPTLVFERYEDFQEHTKVRHYIRREDLQNTNDSPQPGFLSASDHESADVIQFSGRENTAAWKNSFGLTNQS